MDRTSEREEGARIGEERGMERFALSCPRIRRQAENDFDSSPSRREGAFEEPRERSRRESTSKSETVRNNYRPFQCAEECARGSARLETKTLKAVLLSEKSGPSALLSSQTRPIHRHRIPINQVLLKVNK